MKANQKEYFIYFNSVCICGAGDVIFMIFILSTMAAKHSYVGKTLIAHMPESLYQVIQNIE
jgi:hypothetical protein